jgi:hypothetical protein
MQLSFQLLERLKKREGQSLEPRSLRPTLAKTNKQTKKEKLVTGLVQITSTENHFRLVE